MSAPVVYDYIRYVPKTFRLMFSDGTTRDIEPKTISRISLEHYYTSSFLPVFKVEFSTDISTYLRIVADKLKINVQFRLDFYPVTRDEEKDKKVRNWVNGKFALYMEDDSPKLHEELTKVLIEQNKAGGDDTSDAVTNKFLNLSVFLFNESHLNWAYGNISGVVSSANMTDLLTYTLQSLGIKGLMTPLDNSTVYPEIYLPALTRIDLIKYLNAQYGFYEHGYNFFIDFDRFYFLSKKTGCTAWYPDEYKKIIFNIRKSDDGDRFADGSKLVEKEKTVYINVLPSKLSVESPSIMNNMLIGNALTTIKTMTKGTGTASYETAQRGKQLMAYMDNRYNNPWAEKEFAHSMETESRVMTFRLSMSNMHWYKPNKQFVINFENKEVNKIYGGEYKLATMIAVLYNSGDFLENDIIVQFKK